MKKIIIAITAVAMATAAAERKLSIEEYRDKMKAGWVGQIAGVCWGGPTEFKYNNVIAPPEALREWTPDMINEAFGQDDLYVEMTFLKTLADYGLEVNIRQAGIDFANSEYSLWCANKAGRTNLRRGIAPPDSSHPKFNKCPNDIDYQIEADYAGLISPACPQSVIRLGNIFGRLMNYGDGLYGGQFMGGMYAEAFFTTDRFAIIAAGLKCIPSDSQYAEMVRDMVAWYKAAPTDWKGTWAKAVEKYRKNPAYQKSSNGNIDVKINGAMVLLGLLYGEGDFDNTIKIATRGGYDSDCNPSSAAGPLFTSIGFSKLPERFSEKLNNTQKFSYTAYNFPALLDVCEKLARQIVVREGGRIEKGADGKEYFIIPIKEPVPNKLELSWQPGPAEGSLFNESEKAKIKFPLFNLPAPEAVNDPDPTRAVQKCLDAMAPGWITSPNAPDMGPGFRPEIETPNGPVYGCILTHPPAQGKPVILSRKVTLNEKSPRLKFKVANAQAGNFDLIVRVNGMPLLNTEISSEGNRQKFRTFEIGLDPWAGKEVTIELLNQPTGWFCEAATWCDITVR